MNKKIIHVMPEFGLAGAEVMAETLMLELKNKDYNVMAISLYDYQSPITERLKKNEIKVYYMGKKKGFDLKVFRKIYQVLKEEKPDVIHTHRYVMQYVMPIAILLKIQSKVHTVHNIATKEISKPQRLLSRIFYKYFKIKPVAISPRVKASIIEEYSIDEKNVPMIYNGINLNKILKKQDYSIKERVNILHVGRFASQKNHKALLKGVAIAAESYPNIKLQLIGKGELESQIISLIDKYRLNNHVELLGTRDNVYNEMRNTDIFILPSLWEGMPITLIEAMAVGLPIIASDVGGIPDMLTNEKNALLINPTPENISKAIIYMIENPQQRLLFGLEAINAVRRFSAEEMCVEYEKLY